MNIFSNQVETPHKEGVRGVTTTVVARFIAVELTYYRRITSRFIVSKSTLQPYFGTEK